MLLTYPLQGVLHMGTRSGISQYQGVTRERMVTGEHTLCVQRPYVLYSRNHIWKDLQSFLHQPQPLGGSIQALG